MAGEDRWFKLEPRSSASRVQGDCQLVLKLITTQVGARPRARAPPAGSGRAADRRPCLPEGHEHEPAGAVGLPVVPAAAQPSAAVRAPSRRGGANLGPPGQPGRRGEGEAGRPETWGPRGVGSPASTHGQPVPPAQLEQLARRAQRACGHRALPARRTEQPVGAATGCAVSGRGRVARGGVGRGRKGAGLSVGGTRGPCWVGPLTQLP